jgi:hypothetical protein
MEHNAHAHAIYDGVLFISDELAKMSHNVFIAPAGKAYLTSDTPCVWQSALGFTGLANPLLEITLPLTPRHLLHISKTIPSSGYMDAMAFYGGPDKLANDSPMPTLLCRQFIHVGGLVVGE